VQAIRNAIMKRSLMEKCCGFRLGPVVLSKIGRSVILFSYVLAVAIAAYGVSEVKVFFD